METTVEPLEPQLDGGRFALKSDCPSALFGPKQSSLWVTAAVMEAAVQELDCMLSCTATGAGLMRQNWPESDVRHAQAAELDCCQSVEQFGHRICECRLGRFKARSDRGDFGNIGRID